jgi:ketosteroid isomerase-like protein
MSQEALEIVRQVSERWNAHDIDGLFELYHDDMVIVTGEHWPDGNAVLEGKQRFRESTHEWLDVWQSVHVETDLVEAYGDRVVAHGNWITKGRVSGMEGTMPIHIVFTVRDGRIARVEWFSDHDRAVAAARGA